jgi:cell division protein DivIC
MRVACPTFFALTRRLRLAPSVPANTLQWIETPTGTRRSLVHGTSFVRSMKLLRKIPSSLRNRYALLALALLVWITFLDRNDIWTTLKNRHELSRMRDQKEWYTKEIERTNEQLHEISSNKQLLEKFARERYLMKRENEDIFVLVPKEK